MSRHPSVANKLKWLRPNPKLEDHEFDVARECERLAVIIVNAIHHDSEELSTGLRKLIEAKDCFVRASLEQRSAAAATGPTDPLREREDTEGTPG